MIAQRTASIGGNDNRFSTYSNSATFAAAFADRQDHAGSNSEERLFSMRVNVKATQADLPPGTAKLLEILDANSGAR